MNDQSNKTRSTFVVGHKNPDTDSVVSAFSYAYLKQRMGKQSYVAKRAGNVTPQTEFIFNNAGLKIPDLLTDLIPKVKYFASNNVAKFNADDSLWQAIKKMTAEELKYLCLVKEDDSYDSLLSYESFAFYILSQAKPASRTTVTTSINLIKITLNAQVLNLHSPNTINKLHVFTSSSYSATVKKNLSAFSPNSLALITGDRFDLQEHAINMGYRLLIISSGHLVENRLIQLAKQNSVSILSSPYDSTTTSMMLHYSIRASDAANHEIKPVYRNDTIKKIKPLLEASPARVLPVLNSNEELVSLISELDLKNTPNVEVVLVDHNENAQALEGIENYTIKAVIDHHKIGGFFSREPVDFLVKTVGATASIVASLYKENSIEIPKEIALLLLGAIISDTLCFKSATSTDFDKNIAKELSLIAGVEIEAYASQIFEAASKNNNKTPKEIILQDRKVYKEKNMSFSVSQLETSYYQFHIKQKDSYLEELGHLNKSEGLFFSAILITDITYLTSYLIIKGSKDFIDRISYPVLSENIFEMKNILSRKKQLLPFLISQIENY